MNPAHRYVSTRNTTASKEQLMVLLFEAALRHMRAGAECFAAGERGPGAERIEKAVAIVAELSSTLDHAKAPELTTHLAEVYAAVSVRLLESMTAARPEPAREAAGLFEPLVEAFASAVGGA